jgi:hypothetical protein
MIPKPTDNSPDAQAFRAAAVAAQDCPKCGATKGRPCVAAGGGNYDPRYVVHHARLVRAETPAKIEDGK